MWWSLSHVRLFATPWTVACQAPLSTEFSRQEYWNISFSSFVLDGDTNSANWRRRWQSTPGFLPGKSHGQRRLTGGYSLWGSRVGHNWGRTHNNADGHRECFQWTGREEMAVSGEARVLDHFSLHLKRFIFVCSKNSILRGQDHFQKRLIMIWVIQNSYVKKNIEEIRYFGEGIKH